MSAVAAYTRARLNWAACLLVGALGPIIFVWQMLAIHRLWTPIGLVDPWPLYDRLRRYDAGQLSLDHYLLDPHVHPHSIVYFLYLMDARLAGLRQVVPHAASLVCVTALVVLMAWLFRRAGRAGRAPDLGLVALLSGTAIVLSGLSEATILPFQCVITVTRLAYIGLLAILVQCHFRPRPGLHALALAASMIAVTFYASGGVFAAEIILLHLLAVRRWKWLLASTLPLISYLAWAAHYMATSAESNTIATLIRHLDTTTVARIVTGICSYYATPLVDGWWGSVAPGWGTPIVTLMCVGAVVAAATSVWAAWVLIGQFRAQWVRGATPPEDAALRCLMALLSVWVFVSAASAGLLWIARSRIMSMTTPVHFVIVASSRYAAFAAMSFITLLFMATLLRNRTVGVLVSLASFGLLAVTALHAQLSAGRVAAHLNERGQLDQAGVALLMGFSPVSVEASRVWPGAIDDAYWRAQLPITAAFLRGANLSFEHGMPVLGQAYAGVSDVISAVRTAPAGESGGICHLAGSTARFAPGAAFAPYRAFSVTQADRRVVGYVQRSENAVQGYVLCASAARGAISVGRTAGG